MKEDNNYNSVRDSIIVSKPNNLIKLLQPLKQHGMRPVDLQNSISLRGGSFSAALKDAKVLKLIEYGFGGYIELTTDGETFLTSFTDKYYLKKIGNNVRLFKQMYSQGIKKRIEASNFLKASLEPHYTEKYLLNIVNQASLRYIEYMLDNNKQLKKTLKYYRHVSFDNNQKEKHFDELLLLIKELKKLRKRYHKKEIIQVLEEIDDI